MLIYLEIWRELYKGMEAALHDWLLPETFQCILMLLSIKSSCFFFCIHSSCLLLGKTRQTVLPVVVTFATVCSGINSFVLMQTNISAVMNCTIAAAAECVESPCPYLTVEDSTDYQLQK